MTRYQDNKKVDNIPIESPRGRYRYQQNNRRVSKFNTGTPGIILINSIFDCKLGETVKKVNSSSWLVSSRGSS